MTVIAAVIALALPVASDECNTHACLERTCTTASCQRRVIEKRWVHAQRRLPGATQAMLRRLRGCETRGLRYPANYRYHGVHDGAYQYLPSTWHRAGGRQAGAHLASPAEQDVRTARFFPAHRGEWACQP